MKLLFVGTYIRKTFPNFSKKMDHLTDLYEKTLHLQFQFRMFSMTTTRMNNGESVNTGHFTAQKHNIIIDQYNNEKYWWMKKLNYININNKK